MSNWYLFRKENLIYHEIVYENKKNAEEARFDEYNAAVKIQSWYRGIKLRYYLKKLNHFATVVQRFWRGFVGRRLFRIVLKVKINNMCLKKYADSATTIQKRWKGFKVRKYEFDFYKYRQYLKELEVTNQSTIEFLNEYHRRMIIENELLDETKKCKEMLCWAEKHHYLKSTKVQPSIFNSPFNKIHLSKENLLNDSHKYFSRVKKTSLKLHKSEEGFLFDPVCSMTVEKPLPIKRLPPLAAYPPQGPFRKPEEVRKQRYKPFNPSLRVMTEFDSLDKAREAMKNEEWIQRVHDEIFYPVINKEHPYQPMLISSSEYGHISYGTKHFREESKMCENNLLFKTIVPPIDNFDKVNNQYIENYSV